MSSIAPRALPGVAAQGSVLLRNPSTATTMPLAAAALGPRWFSQSSLRYRTQRRSQGDVKISQMKAKSVQDVLGDEQYPLLPSIFVSLPWSEYPSGWRNILKYNKFRFQTYLSDIQMFWRQKLSSRNGFSFRFPSKRRSIAPTAKVLWQEMLEAFAAGDTATLAKICRTPYARQLNQIITRRPKTHQVQFKLLNWNNSLRYPKLVAHNVTPLYAETGLHVEQAVVALSSRQQIATADRTTGQQVAGTFKMQDKVEYVVLVRSFMKGRWADMTPWKIWGTTSPTELDEWDNKMKAFEMETAYRAGWREGEKTKTDKS